MKDDFMGFRPGPRLRRALVASLALAGSAAGCGRTPEVELRELAPGLDPATLRALFAPDSLWQCHCREAGYPRIRSATTAVRAGARLESERAYRESLGRLRPHIARLAGCLRDEYRMDADWFMYLADSQRPYREILAISSLRIEHDRVTTDTTLAPELQIEKLRRIESEGRRLGWWHGVAVCLQSQSRAQISLGNTAEAMAACRRAIAACEIEGRSSLSLSLLLHLGDLLKATGKPDSARIYHESALRMAEESREPSIAARYIRRSASESKRKGRYALASALLRESARRGREISGGEEAFVSLVSSLEFHSTLGTPEVMDDLIARADRSVAKFMEDYPPLPEKQTAFEKMSVEIGRFKAKRLIESGREAEGERLFRSLRDPARRSPEREKYTQLLHAWISSLLDRRRWPEAARLAREGLDYATTHRIGFDQVRFAILLAGAEAGRGKTREAEAALARFRALLGEDEGNARSEWIEHDRIRIRLALAGGAISQAEALSLVGWSRLVRLLSTTDSSVEACLLLDSYRELRQAIHETLAGDPDAGYGFEMAWRGLYRSLGRSRDSDRDEVQAASAGAWSEGDLTITASSAPGSFAESCSSFGRRIRSRLGEAVHLVYFIGTDGVWRWTAGRSGIRREVVPVEAAELSSRVRDIMDRLESAADSESIPAAEFSELRRLLIPSDALVGSAGGKDSPAPWLLVSADLDLLQLPFAALNAAEAPEYHALLETCDVVYLRHVSSREEPAPHAGLVVTEPSYSPELLRRYPSLGPLEFGTQEVATVVSGFPGANVLRRTQATKAGLQSAWTHAGFLYVAAHFIQDAGVPYLSFLPLSGTEGSPLEDSLLEYSEIRETDFSRCRVVVLSGCGTGARYVNQRLAGPSLADAFLDAGAAAVVQTFRDVRDDEAGALTRDFIRNWAAGAHPVTALGSAQRTALSSAGSSPNPVWMAYAVSLSGLP